jgi:predicted  nucleic acid-binding Zn-ribbon protein
MGARPPDARVSAANRLRPPLRARSQGTCGHLGTAGLLSALILNNANECGSFGAIGSLCPFAMTETTPPTPPATSSQPYDSSPHGENHRSGSSRGILSAVCVVLAIVAIALGVKLHQLTASDAELQAQLTQSKSVNAQAQTDLASAKADSAQLHAQLDKDATQHSDLQSRLDKATAQLTDQQTQLDKAKAQATGLKAQVDKSNAASAALQASVGQANAASADLKRQLDEAKSQSADLQVKLQNAVGDLAKGQALAVKAQALPVTTSIEKSFWGGTLVLHIKNVGAAPIKLEIAVSGGDKPRSESGTVASGDTLNVDKLTAGENAVLSSEGFAPMNVAVH